MQSEPKVRKDLKSCPFCGGKPRECSGYDWGLVACDTETCPIEGIAIQPEVWDQRANIKHEE